MGKLLKEIRLYCNTGIFPTTTKPTIVVGDSNASRLQRFATNPDYDIVPFGGAKIDQIARIAEAIIHPGIKNIIILGGTNNLETQQYRRPGIFAEGSPEYSQQVDDDRKEKPRR